jgi:alpha-glucosidase
MPETWAQASVAAQERDETAFLALYRSALAIRRRSRALRAGSFAWRESAPGTLSFERAAGDEVVVCSVSVDGDDLELPAGEVLLADESAAWVRAQDEGRQAPDAFDQ